MPCILQGIFFVVYFTTDATTNSIVLQIYIMLKDSTQDSLYFTINNITLEEVNGGEIYTINPHSSLNKYRFGFNGQERETELSTSHTSAEFWMYDGRIGRRWDLDPVDKPFYSQYSTFGNNPISNIDPNGDNDVFYMKGDKLHFQRTAKGTEIQIKSDEQVYSLSQFPLTTKENRKIVAKIIAHYAKQVGVKDIAGIRNGNKKSSDNPAFTSESEADGYEGKVAIYVNINGGINPKLNDYNNLKNALVHENKHKTNGDIELFKKGSYSFKKHADVYLYQIKDATFKNATIGHKVSTVAMYFAYLISAEKDGNIGEETMGKLINDYNKLNTGIKVTPNQRKPGANPTFSFTLEYKNEQGKTATSIVDVDIAPKTPN